MSAAKIMADDSDALPVKAKNGARLSFWLGALEGFGGPALMGINPSDTHRHRPHIGKLHSRIFKSALRPTSRAMTAPEIERELTEEICKALIEALDKHGLVISNGTFVKKVSDVGENETKT